MYLLRRNFLTSYELLFLCAFSFLHLILPLDGEKTMMGKLTPDFDFDGLPGSYHEFKVAVLGSKEECFYQPISEGSSFFVNFNVLKGGDKKVDFYVKDHTGKVLHQVTSQSTGYYRLDDSSLAIMGVCIDNIYSSFGYKLVHVNIMSVVISHWEEFQKEIQEVHLIADNFTASLSSVQTSIGAMLQSQVQARFNLVKDYYVAKDNNHYVLVWSLGQCVLIVLAAMAQVFSIRRLFKMSNVTPTTAKPRA